MRTWISFFLFFILLFPATGSYSQMPERPSAAKILQDIKKLNVLGTVLYLAAHPDDENTAFIAYMANERLYNTGYLSLTRGDGGQNLIGPEISERLGIIRTQELLQARRIDGGKQFFTRANDFGFSKNPEEVFTIWDKEQLLADAVWVIRKFRPDVIVTRFPTDARAGHGQHSASSILAEEAFDAAADPKRFPEQLHYVQVWQAKRLLWNTSPWAFRSAGEFGNYTAGYVKLDIGTYNPLLGRSYGEISAESRSMHKSQGFGAAGRRGEIVEYFEHTKGSKANGDLFDGINTTWSRVSGSAGVEKLISQAVADFDAANPSRVVPVLLKALKQLRQLPDGYWKQLKTEELQQVIQAAMGLYMEVTADEYAAAAGTLVRLTTELVNRSPVPVTISKLRFDFAGRDTVLSSPLKENTVYRYTGSFVLPENTSVSQPYWLRKPGTQGMFSIEDQQEVGLPENRPLIQAGIELMADGVPLNFNVPVVYKRTDPVRGEIYRPFSVTPPVFLNIADKVYMFAGEEGHRVLVLVKAGKDDLRASVALQVPAGWRVEPVAAPLDLKKKDDESQVVFTVYPPAKAEVAVLKAVATIGNKTCDMGVDVIDYQHIPAQTSFPEASARIVKLDLQKRGERIGYIAGAGDNIPQSLQEVGYQVSILGEPGISFANLKQFDAVILGVRAFNTNNRLKYHWAELLKYVENGGNLIVQYNTNQALLTQEIGPYPITLSRDRITDENAEIRFLNPSHPVLNTPNKITKSDFAGWVQERGLYFPSEWDSRYETVISSNDAGEQPLDGGLLITKYGKGNYIYTGYSWFRQLPAGVPGAYRLFVNLISLGK